jgi:cation diffusion facilitator family transporter
MKTIPSMQQSLATDLTGLPEREKLTVAISSVAAAVLLTALKIGVGVLTGSLGILSEAAHSGLDLVAAVVTLFSVNVANKPADSSHPFGHGKVEHLSAFVETGLLLVTCLWIIWEAIRRLFFHETHVEPSVWAFGVMLISITVDTFRSRALFRVARKYNSQALEADALHFSMDIYSSVVVILGLILVYIANLKNIHALSIADPLAALVVAGIVVFISMRLGKRTVDALVDAAPQGAAATIHEAIRGVPGVLDNPRIRVRQSGYKMFVDLNLTLEANIPFEHAHSVVDVVESKVHEVFPTADVMINAIPEKPATEDLVERIRFVANRDKFAIHDVTVYEVNGRVNVNLDLEVEPALTLEKAHDQASDLEKAIHEDLPGIDEVNIHIEPLARRVETGNEVKLDQMDLEKRLMEIARETQGVLGCHSIEAHQIGANTVVRLRCAMNPELPIAAVHDLTETLEFKFKQAFPQISRVSIHAEPTEPLAGTLG